LNYRIEVDGGVDDVTGLLCKAEGADTFVCGTAYFHAPTGGSFVKTAGKLVKKLGR